MRPRPFRPSQRLVASACILGLASACRGAVPSPPEADAAATFPAAAGPAVLVTDCGTEIDDQWTLAAFLAEAEPRDVALVVGTHAWNVRRPEGATAASCARAVAASVGAEVEIVDGADRAIDDGDLPPSAGADRIVALARQRSSERPLRVYALGAVTDLAIAIAKDPSVAARLDVVMMGFKEWPTGGDSWNAVNDLEAAQRLLDSDARLTIFSEETGRAPLRTDEAQLRQRFGGASGAADWLIASTHAFVTRFPRYARGGAFRLYDLGTWAVAKGLATSDERPRPRLRDDLSFETTTSGRTIRWITGLDPSLLDRLHATLASAPSRPWPDDGAVSYSKPLHDLGGPGASTPTGACATPFSALPDDAMPRCNASTATCVATCALDDSECPGRCVGADTRQPLVVGAASITCNACVFTQQMACYATKGCAAEEARMTCCHAARCASASSACTMTRCGQEMFDLIMCADALAPDCLDLKDPTVRSCFATL